MTETTTNENRDPHHLRMRRRVSSLLAPTMFFLALLFLAVTAALIVVWVDMPRMAEEGRSTVGDVLADPAAFEMENKALAWSELGLTLLLLIWPAFLAEFAFQFCFRDPNEPFWRTRYFSVLICFCPPLRLCARNPDHGDMIWLPGAGWCEVNETLRDKLERTFSIPMILIALLILPVLGLEFGLRDQVMRYTWLRLLLHLGTGVIWFAFAAEFILMVSVADKKLRYCREHWIDLAIILLPLLSFLRSLRIVRAMRVAKFAKLQQITRMGRLYRLRGLAMRAFRAILLLELLDRFIRRDPEKRLLYLREQLAEKEKEIGELHQLIAIAEAELASREADVSKSGEDSGERSGEGSSDGSPADAVGEPQRIPNTAARTATATSSAPAQNSSSESSSSERQAS